MRYPHNLNYTTVTNSIFHETDVGDYSAVKCEDGFYAEDNEKERSREDTKTHLVKCLPNGKFERVKACSKYRIFNLIFFICTFVIFILKYINY